MTGANLARAMQLSAPTVHEMIGRLERDGYVTRDADTGMAQVFQSICTLLGNNRLPIATGQIAAGSPRVGVFVFPDNQRDRGAM